MEESGIVVTAWYHLGLWRETGPKWMAQGMVKGTQQQLIRRAGGHASCQLHRTQQVLSSSSRKVSIRVPTARSGIRPEKNQMDLG